tara:strand:- start:92 stop:475 length:384 start_codon:yes stop_codon:yes gene_type:complete
MDTIVQEPRTKKQLKLDQKLYAEKRLNGLMFQKQEVYCIIRHVSSSGMTRHISFFIIDWFKDQNKVLFIDNLISDYLDYRPNKHYTALVVGGCGMDMAFSVVHHLQEQMNYSKNTDFTDYDFTHRII